MLLSNLQNLECAGCLKHSFKFYIVSIQLRCFKIFLRSVDFDILVGFMTV